MADRYRPPVSSGAELNESHSVQLSDLTRGAHFVPSREPREEPQTNHDTGFSWPSIPRLVAGVTVVACLVGIYSIWPATESKLDSDDALELDQWQAEKEFIEYCSSNEYPSPYCDKAKTAHIGPPPHFANHHQNRGISTLSIILIAVPLVGLTCFTISPFLIRKWLEWRNPKPTTNVHISRAANTDSLNPFGHSAITSQNVETDRPSHPRTHRVIEDRDVQLHDHVNHITLAKSNSLGPADDDSRRHTPPRDNPNLDGVYYRTGSRGFQPHHGIPYISWGSSQTQTGSPYNDNNPYDYYTNPCDSFTYDFEYQARRHDRNPARNITHVPPPTPTPMKLEAAARNSSSQAHYRHPSPPSGRQYQAAPRPKRQQSRPKRPSSSVASLLLPPKPAPAPPRRQEDAEDSSDDDFLTIENPGGSGPSAVRDFSPAFSQNTRRFDDFVQQRDEEQEEDDAAHQDMSHFENGDDADSEDDDNDDRSVELFQLPSPMRGISSSLEFYHYSSTATEDLENFEDEDVQTAEDDEKHHKYGNGNDNNNSRRRSLAPQGTSDDHHHHHISAAAAPSPPPTDVFYGRGDQGESPVEPVEPKMEMLPYMQYRYRLRDSESSVTRRRRSRKSTRD